jgi:N utilization substance protein A
MHVDMAALHILATEKAMPIEPLIRAIEAGVLTAYNEGAEPNRYAQARLDRESGKI